MQSACAQCLVGNLGASQGVRAKDKMGLSEHGILQLLQDPHTLLEYCMPGTRTACCVHASDTQLHLWKLTCSVHQRASSCEVYACVKRQLQSQIVLRCCESSDGYPHAVYREAFLLLLLRLTPQMSSLMPATCQSPRPLQQCCPSCLSVHTTIRLTQY